MDEFEIMKLFSEMSSKQSKTRKSFVELGFPEFVGIRDVVSMLDTVEKMLFKMVLSMSNSVIGGEKPKSVLKEKFLKIKDILIRSTGGLLLQNVVLQEKRKSLEHIGMVDEVTQTEEVLRDFEDTSDIEDTVDGQQSSEELLSILELLDSLKLEIWAYIDIFAPKETWNFDIKLKTDTIRDILESMKRNVKDNANVLSEIMYELYMLRKRKDYLEKCSVSIQTNSLEDELDQHDKRGFRFFREI